MARLSQESHSTIYGLATRDLVWILVQLILECISCMTPPNFMELFWWELLLHASLTISETVNTKSLGNSHLNPPMYGCESGVVTLVPDPQRYSLEGRE